MPNIFVIFKNILLKSLFATRLLTSHSENCLHSFLLTDVCIFNKGINGISPNSTFNLLKVPTRAFTLTRQYFTCAFNMDFHKIHWLLRFNSLQCLKWFSIVKALEDAGIRRTYCVLRNFVDTFNFQYSDQRFWTLNKQCIDRWSKIWFQKYKRFYHFTQDLFDCTTNIKY